MTDHVTDVTEYIGIDAEDALRRRLYEMQNAAIALNAEIAALRAEVERLRNLIMDASEAYEASDPLRIEYRAILAARQEEGKE